MSLYMKNLYKTLWSVSVMYLYHHFQMYSNVAE